mgnify:FL=1
MLINVAISLVIIGVMLLVVGVLIARQYTLRAKLLTAFMFIVLASLGLLAAMDSFLLRQNLTSGANKLLLTTVQQKAEQLDEFFRTTTASLETQSKLPIFRDHLRVLQQPGRIDRNLKNVLQDRALDTLETLRSMDDAVIKSYALQDTSGRILIDTRKDAIGNDESTISYFDEMVRTGESRYSAVMFDNDSNAVIHFSSPVKSEDGSVIGVLRAVYDANILSTIVSSHRGLAGRGSFPILVDENNLRLIHGRRADLQYTLASWVSDDELADIVEQRRLPTNTKRMLFELTDFTEQVDTADYRNPFVETQLYGLGQGKFSAAVASMNTMPWKLVYAQPQSVMMEPVEEQTQVALLIAGGIAAFVVLIVLFTTHVLLTPIRRLTSVVNRIGKGDMDVKAHVDTEDEVGGLATAFNNMTDNLNNLIDKLETEISEHKLTAGNLRKLSQAIEQSPVSVMITDLKGDIEYVNPEFCKVTGYSAEEVKGKNPRFLKSGHTPKSQFINMWNSISTGQQWSGELYNKKKNGDLFWENVTISPIKSSEGKSTHYLAIKEDISIRKDYEEQLMYQASYDKLTDLPNRTLAFDRLKQTLASAIRDKKRLAVIYIDFDHFKNINDTLGHTAGDSFLVSMAERLKGITRDVDTVARLGGDEFMLILTGSEKNSQDETLAEYEEHIKTKAAEILEKVAQPCVVEDMEFSVTASIGIAIFPEDGDDPHILLKNADTAMYRGKRKGRNTFEVFTPEMSDTVVKRVEIESKLRRAYEEEKFYLKYQSLVDARDMRLVGAEALLRWHDEELGNVPPEVFIPFAEETGLIVDIGHWVIDQVCKDVKAMRRDQDSKDLYVAVNLSGRQFRGKGIAKQIEETLSRHKLPGSCLEFEITERLLMKDVPDVIATLNQFKELGIKLSIDDFGTGYSSLSYLKRFPFDVLKIDKSFVQDIGVDPDDAALCEAIISMAHSLGLTVIGEGVENEEQFEFLRSRGAEIIQGYYVSKPMRYEDFKQFVIVSDWIKSTAS